MFLDMIRRGTGQQPSATASGDVRLQPVSLEQRATHFLARRTGPFWRGAFMMRKAIWLAVGGGLTLWLAAGVPTSAADNELPIILREDFEHGMDRWQTTDPDPANSVWEVVEMGEPGNHVLRVKGASKYQPPYRSPLSIAWLKDAVVGDFELTAHVQNTNPSGGNHRDLCIFWGKQSPSQFYYVHYGQKADPHACQIFIVNDSPRAKITVDEAEGTPWDDGWHDLKVTRSVADGEVKVYFDDMTK